MEYGNAAALVQLFYCTFQVFISAVGIPRINPQVNLPSFKIFSGKLKKNWRVPFSLMNWMLYFKEQFNWFSQHYFEELKDWSQWNGPSRFFLGHSKMLVCRSNFFVRLTWNVLSSVMKLKSFALFVLVTKETLNWSTCFTFCIRKSDAALKAGQRFHNK